MKSEVLAYLAGAMDSDGCLTIKRSTYHQRVRGDAKNPVYQEKLHLRQTTPHVPDLLKDVFGGAIRTESPRTPNSKPMMCWECSDKQAATATQLLLPFLRIKKPQALLILELRETKNSMYWQESYWFALEHPNWTQMELVTHEEAAQMLGHKGKGCVSQAIGNGTLLALPSDRKLWSKPRIPRLLVDRLAQNASSDGRAKVRPRQLIEWRERLYQEVRELNKIGIDGTPIYHRTGYYAPK